MGNEKSKISDSLTNSSSLTMSDENKCSSHIVDRFLTVGENVELVYNDNYTETCKISSINGKNVIIVNGSHKKYKFTEGTISYTTKSTKVKTFTIADLCVGIAFIDADKLINLSNEELRTKCEQSPYIRKLCNDKEFWRMMSIKSIPDSIEYYNENVSWREHYKQFVKYSDNINYIIKNDNLGLYNYKYKNITPTTGDIIYAIRSKSPMILKCMLSNVKDDLDDSIFEEVIVSHFYHSKIHNNCEISFAICVNVFEYANNNKLNIYAERACTFGNLDLVNHLYNTVRCEITVRAVENAILSGHMVLARYLMTMGDFDIDHISLNKSLTLNMALLDGHIKVAEIELMKGNIPSEYHIRSAILGGDKRIIQLLKDNKYTCNYFFHIDDRDLNEAIHSYDIAMLEFLSRRMIFPNSNMLPSIPSNKSGFKNYEKLIRFFLDNSIDVPNEYITYIIERKMYSKLITLLDSGHKLPNSIISKIYNSDDFNMIGVLAKRGIYNQQFVRAHSHMN